MFRATEQHQPGTVGLWVVLCLFAFTFTTLWPPPSRAAGDEFCKMYAQFAHEAKKKNNFWKCGFRGPRWEATYQDHYRWCRGVDRYHADREARARSAALSMPRLYIENNTDVALKIEIGAGRSCPSGGCKPVFVQKLSRQTVVGFLPIAASKVRVVPQSRHMQRQLGELKYDYVVNSRGKDTCRVVRRLIITDRSFGKSVIVGPGGKRRSVFANQVVAYGTGHEAPEGRFRNSASALGAPNWDKKNFGTGFVSLGCGGALTLAFPSGRLAVGRVRVHEIGSAVEPTQVEVSDGRTWSLAGNVGGSVSSVDIRPPRHVSVVRLRDLKRACGGRTPGADIDAVELIGFAR